MCDTCREEYADVNDRRFHAQPIACNECGPHYTLRDSEGNEDTVYIHGQSITYISKLVPNSRIGEGLSIHYSGGSSLENDIKTWLNSNGIATN